MISEFDPKSRLAALTGIHPSGGSDWHGLRSRLAAAYAARSALVTGKAHPTAVGGGSFDRGSARMLAVFGRDGTRGLDAINPTALSSGKSNYGNDAAVAGAHMAGD
jgi:hypothetical protein